jgi:hypothetical protein
MFPGRQLKALHARKRQLLNDSSIHRQLLAGEVVCIRQRLAWLERGVAMARRSLPFAALAIPFVRRWRTRSTEKGTAWRRTANALPLAWRLVTMWQSMRR